VGLRAEQTRASGPLESSLHAALAGIHRRFIARCYRRGCPAVALQSRVLHYGRRVRLAHRQAYYKLRPEHVHLRVHVDRRTCLQLPHTRELPDSREVARGCALEDPLLLDKEAGTQATVRQVTPVLRRDEALEHLHEQPPGHHALREQETSSSVGFSPTISARMRHMRA
jgi:hypothetical protein